MLLNKIITYCKSKTFEDLLKYGLHNICRKCKKVAQFLKLDLKLKLHNFNQDIGLKMKLYNQQVNMQQLLSLLLYYAFRIIPIIDIHSNPELSKQIEAFQGVHINA